MGAAKPPVIEDLHAFALEGSTINEGSVRLPHGGAFLAGRLYVAPVGDTGTGKTHLRGSRHRYGRRGAAAGTKMGSNWKTEWNTGR